MHSSPEQILWRLLKSLKLPISRSYLVNKVKSHTEYPSLLSITDVLDDVGIENAALVVDKGRLHEIPTPFIAHTGTKGGEFILVKDINKILKKYPGFEKDWDGTVVAAEKPGVWKNNENDKFLTEEKRNRTFRWLAVSAIFLLAAFSLLNQFTWQNFGLLITSLGGLSIATLIVQHELGISNEITEQLCGAGKNTDCDAVMKSKGSKILTWFNWADAGIIYFSSVFLLLIVSLFSGTLQSLTFLLSLLASCSLPFTLFTVYYQWRVVKKWCPLCLATVAVLWLQFLIILPGTLRSFDKLTTPGDMGISSTGVLLAAFVFAVSVILWLGIVKPELKKNKELTDINFSLLRFKNNPDVFNALLQQQRIVDITPFENDLQLGNPDADLQIMVACNPYCGPCARAHEVLNDLVVKHDIGLTIRFAIKTVDKEDKRLQAVEYILELLNNSTIEYKRKALHDWNLMMDMESFKEKYPMPEDVDVNEQLMMHERWTKESGIEFTPTIFINGYELPKQYKTDDMALIVRKIEKSESAVNVIVDENNLVPA